MNENTSNKMITNVIPIIKYLAASIIIGLIVCLNLNKSNELLNRHF